MRVLACPASLKGVLTAPAAAAALAAGVRAGGGEAVELPVADGGDGTAAVLQAVRGGEWVPVRVEDAFGEERDVRWLLLADGTAVVEAAAALPLDPRRLDPLTASSRGLGQLLVHVLARKPKQLVVCLGGTATMDGGAGLREVIDALPVPSRALCDVTTTLLDAPRVFGPQKGASPSDIEVLERHFAAMTELAAVAELPGAGAAGGLGAALAALGAELVPGADWVLEAVGLAGHLPDADLVVTGEGRVDATTREGKAPAAVVRAAAAAGVRCLVFGGVVETPLPGVETVALSGEPASAASDLRQFGQDIVAQSNH